MIRSIVEVAERKAAEAAAYDQVKPQIIEYLSHRKKQDRVEALVADARGRARVEVLV